MCQQGLDHDASLRLGQFENFIASATERELRDAKTSFQALTKEVSDLVIYSDSVNEAVKELRIDKEAFADQVQTILAALDAVASRL